MYTIYDLEIRKEILSSLTFVAIESGITFNNRLQFDNIIYKLYNYLKDDLDFENGIKINETLKQKINDFKNIYLELPNPPLEDGEKFRCELPKGSQSLQQPFVKEMKPVPACEVGEYIYFPYKFKVHSSSTNGNMYYRIILVRKTDGYETNFGDSASNSSAVYGKIRVRTDSNRYVGYMDLYDKDDIVVKTSGYSGSTSYNPAEYDVKCCIYNGSYPIHVYEELSYDFTIDEENIKNLNSDTLVNGDIYHSTEIAFGNDNEEITINHLLMKTLNGESFGFKYGTIQTYLNKVCKYDKNIFKFLTITANEDETTFTAYVSTYPLYATNVNNELGLWFLNTSDSIPVRVFKSENGEVWKEVKKNISSALPYKTDAIIVQTTALSYAGEDIVYSNYPVFYSLSGSNFEDEVSTIALEEDNTFKLYRNSDEDFTLDRLPLGASFYFGKHKIEDSPRFPLIFRPMDYTNNINTAQGDENWLPSDSVYCETPHLIDKLSFHNSKNNSNANIMYENSHLPRWLNSDAPYGEWWSQINEYDTPSILENMYNNDASKGFEFGHRAGFLYHFDPKERALLQPFNGWSVYKGLKVILLDKSETPDSFSKTYRPKIYKACGSSTVGILRPYFVKEMKYHLHKTTANNCSTELNDFVCTKSDSFFWCRNKGTNNGQYADLSSNGNPAYYGNAVRPVVCLPTDTKVIREPDEHGIFKLDLGIEELVDVRVDYETEINILENSETSFSTNLETVENVELIFGTERIVGLGFNENFETKLTILNNVKLLFDLNRYVVNSTEKTFATKRVANFFHSLKYGTRLKTLENTEKSFYTLRETIEEFKVQNNFELERRILENIKVNYEVCREVLGVVNPTFNTKRMVQENIVLLYDTNLQSITHRDFIFETALKTQKNTTISNSTRRRTTVNNEQLFETSRKVYKASVFDFETQLDILNSVDREYFTKRLLEATISPIFETLRYLAAPTIETFNTERYLVENGSVKYPTHRIVEKFNETVSTFPLQRLILANADLNYETFRNTLQDVLNENVIIRNIVNSFEFKEKVQRYVLENISCDEETIRRTLKDMAIINEAVRFSLETVENDESTIRYITQNIESSGDTERNIVSVVECTFSTRRAVSTTIGKYVSKENLTLYTNLLKQEIVEYVDLRIAQEFAKRNL